MIKWPSELVDSIARRRCVLFLGSGVSANARTKTGKHPPLWAAFLDQITKEYSSELSPYLAEIQAMINNGELLLACEVIVNQLGEHQFGEIAANVFRRPGYTPAKIHEIIYGLDSRVIITPNIDKIYEQYALSESRSTVVVKSYTDKDIAKYLRTDDYLIVRGHGSVDETGKLVFTNSQYGRARIEFATFYRLLDALILTHTFVFIGCGINDPDIQLTLENANFMYEECPPHFFITAKGSFQPGRESVLCKNRNLKVLYYDNLSGSHSELLTELEELKRLVDERRETLKSSCTW